MSKAQQTSALRSAFEKIRSIPGHILDSYESGFKKVEDAHAAQGDKMIDENFGNHENYDKVSSQGESDPGYHDRAQAFIKDAKAKGMGVKSEGSEIIATPAEKSKPFPAPAAVKVGRRIIK